MKNLKKPIESYTVEEVTSASQILERVHGLIYTKLSSGACKVLSPPPIVDPVNSDPHCARIDGYREGLNAGLGCFPASPSVVSLEELLAAVYGEDKPTNAIVL